MRLKSLLYGLLVFFFIPSSTLASGTNPIGYAQTINLKTNSFQVTQVVNSSGGTIKIKVSNVTRDNMYRIWLYEKDENNSDDPIPSSPKYGYGDDTLTWDVSNFVDGDNGKAEIYAHIGYADMNDTVTIQFLD